MILAGTASLNIRVIAKPDFEVGDELDQPLTSGDSISVVFVPSLNREPVHAFEIGTNPS